MAASQSNWFTQQKFIDTQKEKEQLECPQLHQATVVTLHYRNFMKPRCGKAFVNSGLSLFAKTVKGALPSYPVA